MATREVPLYLLDDEAIKKFDEFKLKHGFEEDWEVFAACLNIVTSLDRDTKSNITFLQNGNTCITLNTISDIGYMSQTNINLIGITKGK